MEKPRRESRELPEPARLVPFADALLHQPARFEHLKRHNPVQGGERSLADIRPNSFCRRDATRLLMLHGGDQLGPKHAL